MASQKRAVILAFGLMMTLTTPLFAYEPQTNTAQQPDTIGRRKGQRGLKRHRLDGKRSGFGFSELNLSADQREQTRLILQRHLDSIRGQRTELLQLREKRISGTLTPEDQARAKALHEQLRDARQGVQSELDNLLTAEQRAQLEQIEMQRKARREEKLKRRQERRDRIPQ